MILIRDFELLVLQIHELPSFCMHDKLGSNTYKQAKEIKQNQYIKQ
jgi:hypothetical protein